MSTWPHRSARNSPRRKPVVRARTHSASSIAGHREEERPRLIDVEELRDVPRGLVGQVGQRHDVADDQVVPERAVKGAAQDAAQVHDRPRRKALLLHRLHERLDVLGAEL